MSSNLWIHLFFSRFIQEQHLDILMSLMHTKAACICTVKTVILWKKLQIKIIWSLLFDKFLLNFQSSMSYDPRNHSISWFTFLWKQLHTTKTCCCANIYVKVIHFFFVQNFTFHWTFHSNDKIHWCIDQKWQ